MTHTLRSKGDNDSIYNVSRHVDDVDDVDDIQYNTIQYNTIHSRKQSIYYFFQFFTANPSNTKKLK